jgi:glutamate---cysteine ligase / carboxylate-amine ligase
MSEPRPDWAQWAPTEPYSLGAEEEVMLLNPRDWSLAQQSDRVFSAVTPDLEGHLSGETQGSVVELRSSVHESASALTDELEALRFALELQLSTLGLRAASAGTHPFTVWQETVVSSQPRYQKVYGSMRELARREPTFALHVHVGVPDPEDAIRLVNRMRTHLPLLLALSVNSPFWQGRDTGLASARTPLFQAFPRVGIPREFADYEDWLGAVSLLVRCEAFPEPTFLWWDVRPQPILGTVEVRILDAQTRAPETAALAALIQCVARLEIEEGYADEALVRSPEVLDENRFLAARDGMAAELIDPGTERRIPARKLCGELLDACAEHAVDLDCATELIRVRELSERTGAERQLDLARRAERLPGLVARMADEFSSISHLGEPPDQARRTSAGTTSPAGESSKA